MNDLSAMMWVETRKALRSRLPLWTALGSLVMPLGIAFLIFVAHNPGISKKLGLISAKANLLAYSTTDWPTYFGLYAMLMAAGGFFLFILVISWVFGREFTDGTVKDLLAVPVPRASILLAKFIVTAAWSAALAALMLAAGLIMGALMNLPGGSPAVLLQGAALVAVTAALVIVTVLPFALFASIGRGYLLPVGMAVFNADAGQPGGDHRLGRIFPLGCARTVCAGEKRPSAGQLLGRALHRPGGHGCNHRLVAFCRSKPLSRTSEMSPGRAARARPFSGRVGPYQADIRPRFAGSGRSGYPGRSTRPACLLCTTCRPNEKSRL